MTTLHDEIAAERKRLRLTQPEPKESQIQRAVLRAIALHPKVGWANRMNSGVFRPPRADGSFGFVRAGFEGCADILGQLVDGRLLACEVKRPSGRITEAQAAFLERVRLFGGVAFIARSVDDVFAHLEFA